MGPTWDLSAPDGPHVGPMNIAIRVGIQDWFSMAVCTVIQQHYVKFRWKTKKSMFSNKHIFMITWQHHQMETFSMLLALCAGNSPVTSEFPSQRPATWSFDVFFDLHLTNSWANTRDTGDLRRHQAHYGVTVMVTQSTTSKKLYCNRLMLRQVHHHWSKTHVPYDMLLKQYTLQVIKWKQKSQAG